MRCVWRPAYELCGRHVILAAAAPLSATLRSGGGGGHMTTECPQTVEIAVSRPAAAEHTGGGHQTLRGLSVISSKCVRQSMYHWLLAM